MDIVISFHSFKISQKHVAASAFYDNNVQETGLLDKISVTKHNRFLCNKRFLAFSKHINNSVGHFKWNNTW